MRKLYTLEMFINGEIHTGVRMGPLVGSVLREPSMEQIHEIGFWSQHTHTVPLSV